MTDATRARILRIIAAATLEHGDPPSVREIADALGMSTSGTFAQLTALVEAGQLRHSRGRGYALAFLPQSRLVRAARAVLEAGHANLEQPAYDRRREAFDELRGALEEYGA